MRLRFGHLLDETSKCALWHMMCVLSKVETSKSNLRDFDMLLSGSNTHWRITMHRHLIAGAFACFGSSLFGQTIDNPANQAQGTLNNIQNTLQNGLQRAADAVDRNVPQSSGASVLGDGQNRSSLNSQGQINGAYGPTGNVGVQSNTNLQNNLNQQPGQLNSNLSTQGRGQSTFGTQQRGSSVPQDQYNPNGQNGQYNQNGQYDQYGNTIQAYGNNGSQSLQRRAQPMQAGQSPTRGWNSGTGQNSGSMQYRPQSTAGNSTAVDNMQQPLQSQNAGRVYVLRFDANGREFICVDGRPVYFDNVNSVSAQGNSGTQNQYRAGYGNYDSKNGQNTQDQFRNGDQRKSEQQTNATGQNAFGNSTNSRIVDPVNSPKTTNGPEVASPDRDRLRLDKQNESTGRQNEGETNLDFDAKANAINPSKTSNDPIEPKS